MGTTRRQFLAQTLVLTWGLSAACQKVLTREELLFALARDLAVPDLLRIVRESRALRASVDVLASAPDATRLAHARAGLKRALLAWQRAYAFRRGPIVESHALLRATFWPPRRAAMASVIEGREPIDAKVLSGLGVDAKGLFALELLLFADEASDAPWLATEQKARVLAFAQAIARDVEAHAERASGLMGDGTEFAQRFARGGQTQVNTLVNEMLATVETAASWRIDRVLALKRDGKLVPGEVQGAPSGLSSAIPRTWLEVCRELYERDQSGLGTLVAAAAPEIHRHMRELFAAATSSLETLDQPLEHIARAQPERLERSVRTLKQLEQGIKVELASALGVTLTFTSSDGD